ncbi:hypothetical protein HOG81_03250 [bacterium]|nr:hypothetical protein [bacterium]
MIRQLFKLLLSLVLVGGIHISSSGDLRFGESLSAQSKKKKKSAKKKRSSRKKKSSKKKNHHPMPQNHFRLLTKVLK